jgi:dihydroorotate dehydrogenase
MLYKLLLRFLFLLPAEFSHKFVLSVLKVFFKSDRVLHYFLTRAPKHEIIRAGIAFKNPVGLAGGFDKNGDYIDALFALGFGFVEVGTVTPVAQKGNKKPRLFRLRKHKALINRMGFNNKGVDYLVEQLKHRRAPGVVGVNIGKNKSTLVENAADDYLFSLEKIYAYADYITINISSPNTPGLRKLQSVDLLESLLGKLSSKRDELLIAQGKKVPVFIKITVDLEDNDMCMLARLVAVYGFAGIISTNTTTSRDGVGGHVNADQPGGLSGLPLTSLANRQMQRLNDVRVDDMILIGSGGVITAHDALARVSSGADLIQLYTGFIYSGPTLIRQIVEAWSRVV